MSSYLLSVSARCVCVCACLHVHINLFLARNIPTRSVKWMVRSSAFVCHGQKSSAEWSLHKKSRSRWFFITFYIWSWSQFSYHCKICDILYLVLSVNKTNLLPGDPLWLDISDEAFNSNACLLVQTVISMEMRNVFWKWHCLLWLLDVIVILKCI